MLRCTTVKISCGLAPLIYETIFDTTICKVQVDQNNLVGTQFYFPFSVTSISSVKANGIKKKGFI